jgi:hypothetical protein
LFMRILPFVYGIQYGLPREHVRIAVVKSNCELRHRKSLPAATGMPYVPVREWFYA